MNAEETLRAQLALLDTGIFPAIEPTPNNTENTDARDWCDAAQQRAGQFANDSLYWHLTKWRNTLVIALTLNTCEDCAIDIKHRKVEFPAATRCLRCQHFFESESPFGH